MPEPLTFTLVGVKQRCWALSPAEAVAYHRRGHKLEPNRPLVADDFREYNDRDCLRILGYFSLDYRRKPETRLADAYAALGLDREAEATRIAEKPIRELRAAVLAALDELVLEAADRRRA